MLYSEFFELIFLSHTIL